ncbi:hypothetical protein QVD17_31972 [Tagetes erecta]|uniref:Uncharacterized protein n=1 Tax=Tagetes erecta TaxID=13708 RepID=A0AAD8K6N1_TARER|nr:hypothetical protein QVD17_31972 [Tagetes erecta]
MDNGDEATSKSYISSLFTIPNPNSITFSLGSPFLHRRHHHLSFSISFSSTIVPLLPSSSPLSLIQVFYTIFNR